MYNTKKNKNYLNQKVTIKTTKDDNRIIKKTLSPSSHNYFQFFKIDLIMNTVNFGKPTLIIDHIFIDIKCFLLTRIPNFLLKRKMKYVFTNISEGEGKSERVLSICIYISYTGIQHERKINCKQFKLELQS